MRVGNRSVVVGLMATLIGGSIGWSNAQDDSPKDPPRAEKKEGSPDRERPAEEPRRSEGRPPRGDVRRDGERPTNGPRPEGAPPRDGERPGVGPRPEGGPGRGGDRGPGNFDPRRGGGPDQGQRGTGMQGRPGFGGPGMRGGAGPQPPFGPNPDNLREHDPEMIRLTQREQELDRKSRDLSDQLRRGRNVGADQKEQIKKQLADVVSRHFDVRQERRELELKRMEDEIERLRATVKSYREKREAAVQRRLSQLMDVDDLDF